MNSFSKKLLLSILILLLLLSAGYFLLAVYYRDGFSLNTWINGVYCTGKSPEEVNKELLSQTKATTYTVIDLDGTQYSIDLSEVGYEADYLSRLDAFLAAQNPYLWVDNLFFHREHTLSPIVTCDEEELKDWFLSLPFARTQQTMEKDYLLTYSADFGYTFLDGLANRLDVEAAFAAIASSVADGECEMDLALAGCYVDHEPDAQQKERLNLWEKLKRYQSCDILYCFGEDRRSILTGEMASMLAKDAENMPLLTESGELILNEEAVRAFVKTLAEEFDTYGSTREFLSTRGDLVTIEGGTYGSLIDQEAETQFLLDTLLADKVHSGSTLAHVPTYARTAFAYGKNDIGSTYIEVDMGEQRMYYYEKGELILATDIVTGNTGRRMGTPEGVNYVYNKQTDRILRGPGYATYVKYWMPVKGGIGIHDATWRKEFGGEIYKTAGSHGCINTPKDQMEILYERVQIGTPVVMFY